MSAYKVMGADTATYLPPPKTLDALRAAIIASGSGIEHHQDTPLATWTINHSFGRRPNVTVYLNGEAVSVGYDATDTQVIIEFPSPVTGSVVLT